MTTQEKNQLEVDFEDIADKLYTIDKDGNIFKLNKLDFDNTKQNLQKTRTGVLNGRSSVLPENKNKSKSDSMEKQNITRDIETSEEYAIRSGDEDEEEDEEEEEESPSGSKAKGVAKSIGGKLLSKVLAGASSKKDVVSEEEEEDEELESEEENEEDMATDLTTQQVEENYWVETEFSKPRTDTAIMETRISKCQEATGKSREECSKEVKKRMKDKNGSENTNTDMVEICPKKLATLEKKAQEYDMLMTEKEKLKTDLESFKSDFLVMKKEYEAKKAQEVENERQSIIKELQSDFLITEDKLKPKSLEQLRNDRDILHLALSSKKAKEEKPANIEDFQANMDIMSEREKELDKLYRCKL